MLISPEPSTSRGEITLQPSYFTSSLYVQPLREDLSNLVALFTEQYKDSIQPFELFKKLWTEQGWCWLHMRVYDGRARQVFLRVTERIFIERLTASHPLLERVVALFSLYTFHYTQPCTSAPPVCSEPNIALPIDLYEAVMSLPSQLTDSSRFAQLQSYVIHILTTLLDAQAFHILPHSSLRAQNPSVLPREIFIPEGQDPLAVVQATRPDEPAQQPTPGAQPKKKGRPSKRDKARKVKEAFVSLKKYVDKNTVLLDGSSSLPGSASSSTVIGVQSESTHAILRQAPHTSLSNYLTLKHNLLETVYTSDGSGRLDTSHSQGALRRANGGVYERLKQIDAIAAEKGMEVGGEGGEQTALDRVGRAVEELQQSCGRGAHGGILGLLEGAGMSFSR